jgi:hypothetical protein
MGRIAAQGQPGQKICETASPISTNDWSQCGMPTNPCYVESINRRISVKSTQAESETLRQQSPKKKADSMPEVIEHQTNMCKALNPTPPKRA